MKRINGDDDTLADTLSRDPTTEPRNSERTRSGGLTHYDLKEVLGRGGMGEVTLARDIRIGRDVAIKRLRDRSGNDEAIVRFLREAKIQARLDHPAIVPVHELGTDEQGEPYFTMKRLAGVTLAALIEAGTETRQRLLRAFVDIALAIDLAHSKRIVHRDLKPANIMLGDYGEVYVLDWGLARELDEPISSESVSTTQTPISGVTAIGSLLGTPGYMPPEQIRDASGVGTAADSYALGAILFEILTGEPLHLRAGALASTLEGTDGSPSRRCPDREIPPELDRLCVEALTSEPSERPSARMLSDRVQSYLDGDRDLAMRREAAREAFELAQTALAAKREDEAMRAAGRALALDPSSAAAEIVARLMLEPPEQPTPELLGEIAAADTANTVRHAKQATVMSLMILPLVGLAMWNGVLAWRLVGSLATISCVLALAAHGISRHPANAERDLWAYAVGMAAMVALVGRLCSPLVIAPGTACLVIMSIVTYPTFVRRAWLVVCSTILGWLIPVILELLEVIRPTWTFAGGELRIQSYAIQLDGAATTIFVLTSTIVVFVAAAILAVTIARSNHLAQRQLLIQRWRLSRLMGSGATSVAR